MQLAVFCSQDEVINSDPHGRHPVVMSGIDAMELDPESPSSDSITPCHEIVVNYAPSKREKTGGRSPLMGAVHWARLGSPLMLFHSADCRLLDLICLLVCLFLFAGCTHLPYILPEGVAKSDAVQRLLVDEHRFNYYIGTVCWDSYRCEWFTLRSTLLCPRFDSRGGPKVLNVTEPPAAM